MVAAGVTASTTPRWRRPSEWLSRCAAQPGGGGGAPPPAGPSVCEPATPDAARAAVVRSSPPLPLRSWCGIDTRVGYESSGVTTLFGRVVFSSAFAGPAVLAMRASTVSAPSYVNHYVSFNGFAGGSDTISEWLIDPNGKVCGSAQRKREACPHLLDATARRDTAQRGACTWLSRVAPHNASSVHSPPTTPTPPRAQAFMTIGSVKYDMGTAAGWIVDQASNTYAGINFEAGEVSRMYSTKKQRMRVSVFYVCASSVSVKSTTEPHSQWYNVTVGTPAWCGVPLRVGQENASYTMVDATVSPNATGPAALAQRLRSVVLNGTTAFKHFGASATTTVSYTLALAGTLTTSEFPTGGGLGRAFGWVVANGTSYAGRSYENGTVCGSSVRNRAVVLFACGASYALLNFTEPAPCQYRVTVSSPDVCGAIDLQVGHESYPFKVPGLPGVSVSMALPGPSTAPRRMLGFALDRSVTSAAVAITRFNGSSAAGGPAPAVAACVFVNPFVGARIAYSTGDATTGVCGAASFGLGNFSGGGWLLNTASNTYAGQYFDAGDFDKFGAGQCQYRSAVAFECGAALRVTNVTELAPCVYYLRVTHPAWCSQDLRVGRENQQPALPGPAAFAQRVNGSATWTPGADQQGVARDFGWWLYAKAAMRLPPTLGGVGALAASAYSHSFAGWLTTGGDAVTGRFGVYSGMLFTQGFTNNGAAGNRCYGQTAVVAQLACGPEVRIFGAVREDPLCTFTVNLTHPGWCGVDRRVGFEAAPASPAGELYVYTARADAGPAELYRRMSGAAQVNTYVPAGAGPATGIVHWASAAAGNVSRGTFAGWMVNATSNTYYAVAFQGGDAGWAPGTSSYACGDVPARVEVRFVCSSAPTESVLVDQVEAPACKYTYVVGWPWACGVNLAVGAEAATTADRTLNATAAAAGPRALYQRLLGRTLRLTDANNATTGYELAPFTAQTTVGATAAMGTWRGWLVDSASSSYTGLWFAGGSPCYAPTNASFLVALARTEVLLRCSHTGAAYALYMSPGALGNGTAGRCWYRYTLYLPDVCDVDLRVGREAAVPNATGRDLVTQRLNGTCHTARSGSSLVTVCPFVSATERPDSGNRTFNAGTYSDW